MRVPIVFILAFLALAATEKDTGKIFRKDLKVPFNDRRIPHKPSARITHGDEAVPHSRPWQVALHIPVYERTIFCSGSLIDEQNILTNGNCVIDAIGPIEIILGAHNLQEQEATQVVVSSSDYLAHEDYNSYLDNDIGLIRLPSPVTLNEYIQPISVDNSSCRDNYTGREANVSGWGVEKETGPRSPVLREVTVPVISNNQCSHYYGGIIPTKLCTDNAGGKTACHGDGGGPLVLDGEQLIGIVSFLSSFGCEAGQATGYTRVCKYSDWIEQNKKQ